MPVSVCGVTSVKDQVYVALVPDDNDWEPSKVTVEPTLTIWFDPAFAAGAPPDVKVTVAVAVVEAGVI